MNSRHFILGAALGWSSLAVYAQDIRAATYQLVYAGQDFEYSNQLKLYVATASDLDRDSVMVFNGVFNGWLYLTSSIPATDVITCHTYQKTFTYPGPGVYELQVNIYGWVENILNFDNSGGSLVTLSPVFTIGSFGDNSTPICTSLQSNITQTTTGAVFNPVVYDTNSDSLTFTLTLCSGQGYYVPSGSTIDQLTGTIISNPTLSGLYAFCTKVDEYRANILISTTYTNMVMPVDHVTGLTELITKSGPGLTPNILTLNGTVVVRAQGTSYLQIFNVWGEIVVSRTVEEDETLSLSISSGIYTYILKGPATKARQCGKLIVF